MNQPKILGKFIYIVTWPGIRLLLLGTTRVYLVIKVDQELFVTKNWLGLHKYWRLPGGGLNHKEDPIAGLKREIEEELGLNISGYKINQTSPKPLKNSAGYKYLIYTVNLPKKPEINVNQKEVTEFRWYNYQDLSNYPCSEELKKALKDCFL